MKILFLLASTCLLVISADDISNRGTNAANVASAGIDACRNSKSGAPQTGTIPYLTQNSYMTQALGIIGGVMKYYQHKQMEKQFKDAMNDLNYRFDELQNDMDNQFAQLTAFVDRKQFQSDIGDPTSILWGEMQAYAQYPNNNTEANIRFECMRQTPWQIATKLRNRLMGPDNSLLTQVKGAQYSNSSFMQSKDVVISRMFQLVMVQSFCAGVENGPNYNVSEDWGMQRIYKIYSDIVSKTISSRVQQETDYFSQAIPSIVQTIVSSNNKAYYQSFADNIYSTLSSLYQWDRFGVVVADSGCDHVGGFFSSQYSGSYDGKGYSPFAATTVSMNNVDVYIIRYWAGQNEPTSRYSQYQGCMQLAYNGDASEWGQNIMCGQAYNVLSNSGSCGANVRFAPASDPSHSYYFVSAANYKDGYSTAVWPAQQRSTTVQYDLGFWERPIPIQLLPF